MEIITSIIGMFIFMSVLAIPITLREMNKKLDVIITHLENNKDNK